MALALGQTPSWLDEGISWIVICIDDFHRLCNEGFLAVPGCTMLHHAGLGMARARSQNILEYGSRATDQIALYE